jgi:hypothetical protein
MSSSYGCQLGEQMSERRAGWDESRAASAAMVLPAQNVSMREIVIMARETAMVLVLQIAFRAALLLRRWNY